MTIAQLLANVAHLIVATLRDFLAVYPEMHLVSLSALDLELRIKRSLFKCLTNYHKSLVINLKKKSTNEQVKTLTDPPFLLGFSEVQIAQVLDNCENIFTLLDVLDKVEIWDLKHAHKIIAFISQVYGDIGEIEDCMFECDISSTELDQFDDAWNREWDDLL